MTRLSRTSLVLGWNRAELSVPKLDRFGCTESTQFQLGIGASTLGLLMDASSMRSCDIDDRARDDEWTGRTERPFRLSATECCRNSLSSGRAPSTCQTETVETDLQRSASQPTSQQSPTLAREGVVRQPASNRCPSIRVVACCSSAVDWVSSESPRSVCVCGRFVQCSAQDPIQQPPPATD